jgi:hypothetical protein
MVFNVARIESESESEMLDVFEKRGLLSKQFTRSKCERYYMVSLIQPSRIFDARCGTTHLLRQSPPNGVGAVHKCIERLRDPRKEKMRTEAKGNCSGMFN